MGAMALCALAATLGACVARVDRAGHGDATYAMRTLSTTLPDDVRVPAALAAAEAALRARGYTVTARRTNVDAGFVVARPSSPGPVEHVQWHARVASEGTFVSITCEPLGSEPIARALLDAMLQRLGL